MAQLTHLECSPDTCYGRRLNYLERSKSSVRFALVAVTAYLSVGPPIASCAGNPFYARGIPNHNCEA